MSHIKIEVNGERREVEIGLSIAALLESLGFANRAVAVERNRDVVPRADHGSTTLEDGDQIEVVAFVGGG